jgi:hypothetical protein
LAVKPIAHASVYIKPRFSYKLRKCPRTAALSFAKLAA